MTRNSTAWQDDPVAWQAGQWLLELESPQISTDRIAEWQRWMTSDERHRQTYEALLSTWGMTGNIPAPRWPNEHEVRVDRYEPEQTVSAWQAQRSLPKRRAWFVPLTAAAAIGALAVGVQLSWPLFSFGGTAVETHVGQSRELRLEDGSRMFVGPGSRLTIDIDKYARRIVLKQGEAYFEVEKDPSRPFSVRAGATGITALGTAFNVRRTGSQIVVAVSEGAVAVDSTRLDAGQQIRMESTISTPAVESVAPQAVAGWREGRLQFSGEPLASVVADVNRYTARHITIDDDSIADLRVTGTVSAGNIESWLKSLEKALPVRVKTAADGKLLLSASQD